MPLGAIQAHRGFMRSIAVPIYTIWNTRLGGLVGYSLRFRDFQLGRSPSRSAKLIDHIYCQHSTRFNSQTLKSQHYIDLWDRSITIMSSFMETLPRPVKSYHSKPYDRISKQHGFEGHGKTVLITGGASGIGYNMSNTFAATGVARISIVGRSATPLEEAKSSIEAVYPSVKVLAYQASITDHARMIEILQKLEILDVLVLNAAVAHRRIQATEITTEEVEDAFDINAIAAFNLTKAFLALTMPSSSHKTIINISTAAAHILNPMRVGYGSSKAAGVQIMQGFASQYKDDPSVNIFSFHPGAFYTPGVAANFAMGDVKWDEPDLPAYFALWLAGPESRFLHGRFLWANWDVDELIGMKERLEKEDAYLTIGLIQ